MTLQHPESDVGASHMAERTDAGVAGLRRPKMLFLCQALPFPPDDGVQVRAYNLLRLLADRFDVTALCFYRKSARPDAEDVRAAIRGLAPLANVSVFTIPQDESRVRFVWDHLRSVLERRAYTQYVYENAAFRDRLKAAVSERSFDVVHVDSLDLVGCLDLLDGLPVVCGHHNIESELLLRRSRMERSPLRRWYLAFQAGLLRREERRWCTRVALNIVVSPLDQELLEVIAPGARVRVASNGVDTRGREAAVGHREGVLFMGGYSWAPNRDGMRFFCESILPLIRRRIPKLRVTWIGRVPEAVRRAYAERYDVNAVGYVDDINDWLRNAACSVVPLQVGGGTRVKILDSWAAGVPVVSTRIGCEGLAAEDGGNVLIRDDPSAFAAAVCDVIQDETMALRIGHAGRGTVEREYEWQSIGNTIVPEYLRLAEFRPTAARAT